MLTLLLFSFLSSLFWNQIYLLIQKNKMSKHLIKYGGLAPPGLSRDKKLSRNTVSMYHSVLVIGLCYMESHILIKYLSIGYFLYDTIHTLKQRSLLNSGFILHHILCMIALNYIDDKNYTYHFIQFIKYSEISNIPMYIVYDMMHTKKNPNVIALVQCVQTILFMIIRGPILFYYGFNLTTSPNVTYYVSGLWIVYGLGLFWGSKLLRQVYNILDEHQHALIWKK